MAYKLLRHGRPRTRPFGWARLPAPHPMTDPNTTHPPARPARPPAAAAIGRRARAAIASFPHSRPSPRRSPTHELPIPLVRPPRPARWPRRRRADAGRHGPGPGAQGQGRRHLHGAGRTAVGLAHPQGADRRPRPRRDRLRVLRERHQRRLRARHAPVRRAGQQAGGGRGLRGRGRARQGLSADRLPDGFSASRSSPTSRCSTTTSRNRPT